MKLPKIATVWLEGCSGCHMSLLDTDEALLDILSRVQLTDSPLTDFKAFNFQEIDLGIIEGGIANTEEAEIAKKLRKKCKILMAWGDCAVFGGINTLRNSFSTQEILHRGYVETPSTVNGEIPVHESLPRLLEKAAPVNQMVGVDVYVPGCPPSPQAIVHCLKEILEGRIPVLPHDMMQFD